MGLMAFAAVFLRQIGQRHISPQHDPVEVRLEFRERHLGAVIAAGGVKDDDTIVGLVQNQQNMAAGHLDQCGPVIGRRFAHLCDRRHKTGVVQRLGHRLRSDVVPVLGRHHLKQVGTNNVYAQQARIGRGKVSAGLCLIGIAIISARGIRQWRLCSHLGRRLSRHGILLGHVVCNPRDLTTPRGVDIKGNNWAGQMSSPSTSVP